jgi:hypothetical protein
MKSSSSSISSAGFETAADSQGYKLGSSAVNIPLAAPSLPTIKLESPLREKMDASYVVDS